MNSRLQKWIGPKEFYQKTTRLAVPLSFQMLLGSALSIVDTIMVSWIGMVTPVGTAAQVDTLCSMIAYGTIGGIAMFSAQFYGAHDTERLKKSFGLMIALSGLNALFWFILAALFGYQICWFYMPDAAVCANAMEYLSIFKYSFLLGSLSFSFSYMYRSIGQAKLPLLISILTTVSNILLDLLLIFGAGPIPALGIKGAALASVIAQGIGLCTNILYAIIKRPSFIGSLKEMFTLPKNFVTPIFKKIGPLILNETLFGFGTTLFTKAFGQLGTKAMDAYYVGNQIFNIFLFVVYGYGNAVSVLLGNLLGSGRIDRAKEECRYHLGLSLVFSAFLVILMILFAGNIVDLFSLNDPYTYTLAVQIVYVFAVKVSMRLFNFVIFSILKAGGESKIVQALDSGILWIVGLPCAFICVNVFGMTSIVLVLLITQLEQLVRLIFGMKEVLSDRWAKDLTVLVRNS